MARGRPGEVESGHESAGPMAAYSARLKVMVKVLDFVKSGGPDWTELVSEVSAPLSAAKLCDDRRNNTWR